MHLNVGKKNKSSENSYKFIKSFNGNLFDVLKKKHSGGKLWFQIKRIINLTELLENY